MKRYYFLLVVFIAVLLTGCLSPVKPPKTTSYVLNRMPSDIPKRQTRGSTLLVTQPETRPVYNTTQMAYTIKPYQVAYFSHNQWAETPSQMLQPLIVQTLQNTHRYHAVVSPPYLGRYEYVLNTHILQLQQDFIHRTPVLTLNVRAVLTRVSTNRVVATKLFTVRVPIRQGTPYNGVVAANEASAQFLEKLAQFCLSNT